MTDHNSSLVNLSIPSDVTRPIVAAKIQEAVLAALGGSEKLVADVIYLICNQKVASDGKISGYSSDNKYSWLDLNVTNVIKAEVEKELKEQIKVNAQQIKDELIKQISTKKGASKIAEALLSSLNGTFESGWKSKIEIFFEPKKD